MNNYRIDNLQYCNWSKEIFQINNEAKLDAVHVTIAYHEDFNEVKKNVEAWNKHFQDYENLMGAPISREISFAISAHRFL